MFVKLQRIIDKIRQPIQQFIMHANGRKVVKNKAGCSHMTTA